MQRTALKRAVAGALVTGAVALVGAAPAAAQFTPGSSGLGDPFFPFAGNGGYDVRHYSLDLDYVRATNHLIGEAEIRARATQSLSSFNLDLRGFTISDLEVDDRDATFTRSGQELTVTPQRGIRRGDKFEVELDYAGTPERVIDPDGSSEGWVPTSDGAYVVNEPQGSPGWYPANDNPMDKATYDFEVTVPEGITAIGNGRLLSKRTAGGKTTWHWYEDSLMAPYLTTVTNGVFEMRVSKWRGMPIYHAVDPQLDQVAWTTLAREPQILDFFSELYGPYPFTSSGGIVDDGRVGYALESQTRSNYDRRVSPSTHVHEVAHQWFGNAVTLSVWPDIWLNEGFATWSEWIWDEHTGGPSAAETFDATYASFDEWDPAPAALPGPEVMFHSPPYDRGAMTLQALREKLGDQTFFKILRSWYRENKYGNVTTADFIQLSERTSRQQLDEFFDVWLYQPVKPTTW
jgi:aminopeptidase N